MIDYEKLDKLMELPVSEEMLGAYLEGNLNEIEADSVHQLISQNDELLDISQTDDYDSNIDDEEIDLTNFQLPFISLTDSFYDDTTSINIQEFEIDNILNELNTMKTSHNLEAANRIFGEAGNGTEPVIDPLISQGPEGVCAIRSQQIILRDYGIDVSLEELKQFAIQNGWYQDGGGTPMAYVGAIIDACGVGVRQEINCTVYDLVNELAQGHRVIVGVDANELWADRNGDHYARTQEFIKDIFNEGANHALIVAGVEVNPNDPEDVKVILTDPGTGDLRIEYTLEQFMDAWEDSDCFMTTTTTPAPYQYDETRGCMVPSNFAVEQYVNANILPLQADVRIPDGYMVSNAYYSEGHLNSIGDDVSYDEFNENFTRYKSVLSSAGTMGQDHFDINDFKSSMKQLFSSYDGFESNMDYMQHVGSHHNPSPEPNPYPHTYFDNGGNETGEEDDGDDDGEDDGGDDDDDDNNPMFN